MARMFELKTSVLKQESAGIHLPLPQGPYIFLSQFDPRATHTDTGIGGMKWEKALSLVNRQDIIPLFDLAWGHVVFGNVDGKATTIGHWLDTSG